MDSDVRLKRDGGHGHSASHAAGPVQPGSDSGSAVAVTMPSAARRRAEVLRGGGQRPVPTNVTGNRRDRTVTAAPGHCWALVARPLRVAMDRAGRHHGGSQRPGAAGRQTFTVRVSLRELSGDSDFLLILTSASSPKREAPGLAGRTSRFEIALPWKSRRPAKAAEPQKMAAPDPAGAQLCRHRGLGRALRATKSAGPGRRIAGGRVGRNFEARKSRGAEKGGMMPPESRRTARPQRVAPNRSRR